MRLYEIFAMDHDTWGKSLKMFPFNNITEFGNTPCFLSELFFILPKQLNLLSKVSVQGLANFDPSRNVHDVTRPHTAGSHLGSLEPSPAEQGLEPASQTDSLDQILNISRFHLGKYLFLT